MLVGSYERTVNCSWEALQLPKSVDYYFSCLAIPNVLVASLQELKENRRLNIAYDTSDVVATVVPPFYSGNFENGTYYLPAGRLLNQCIVYTMTLYYTISVVEKPSILL